jgi:hypothetical protein
MTEAEWLTCEEPGPMLGLLRGRASARKLRQFDAGCARTIWDPLVDERSRRAVTAAEGLADGAAGGAEVEAAAAEAWDARDELLMRRGHGFRPGSPLYGAVAAACAASPYRTFDRFTDDDPLLKDSPLAQAALLADIFGNPFRPAAFDPAWRTSTATALARQMYESRDFSAMPILADALQDAGCDSDDILNHCRDPHATHVRGCWVVDLVLGKE